MTNPPPAISKQTLQAGQKLLYLWLVFVAYVTAIIARHPPFFTSPRLWADEGETFIAAATRLSPLEGIFMPQQGYFSLLNNLLGVICAYMLPPLGWPVLTTWFAFFVQLLPAALLLTSNAFFLRRPIQRLAAVAIVLLAPSSQEVWLNSTNSQSYLCLASAIILASSAPSRHATYARSVVLVLSGLNGVLTCMLAPLFWLKAWQHKTFEAKLQAGLISLCALVQAGYVAYSMFYLPDSMEDRFHGASFRSFFGVLFTKHILLNFTGTWGADVLGGWHLHDTLEEGGWQAYVVASALCSLWLAIIYLLTQKLPLTGQLVTLAFITLSCLTFLPSLGEKHAFMEAMHGGRYYYATNVLFGLMLLVRMARLKSVGLQIFLGALLVIYLVAGANHFLLKPNGYFEGERWSVEAAQFKNNRCAHLVFWPRFFTADICLPRQKIN